MNSNQARSELDAKVSRLDTQADIISLALDKTGGISKTSVRAFRNAANDVIVSYYRLVNAEKRESEASTE